MPQRFIYKKQKSSFLILLFLFVDKLFIKHFAPVTVEKNTHVVAEAYTTQPNSKASSRVLYNIFESSEGLTVVTHVCV